MTTNAIMALRKKKDVLFNIPLKFEVVYWMTHLLCESVWSVGCVCSHVFEYARGSDLVM